jgi:hypothetical protein
VYTKRYTYILGWILIYPVRGDIVVLIGDMPRGMARFGRVRFGAIWYGGAWLGRYAFTLKEELNGVRRYFGNNWVLICS